MKTKWFILGFIVIGGIVTAMLLHQKSAPQVATAQPRPASSSPVTAPVSVAVQELPPAEPQVQPAPKAKPTAQPTAQAAGANPSKEPLHDPDARDALALVGLDPVAEQYWLEAIFDSSLPDNEREDLMEDLNETGFDDPKNLTADDLPLILNRLQIIAVVLPSADDFMIEHLLEAQKDLANMYARVAPR